LSPKSDSSGVTLGVTDLSPTECKELCTLEAVRARTIEALARSVAKEHGMLAIKSDKASDNYGGFQLVSLASRTVIEGARFELSALNILAITNKNQQNEISKL
jgi:hypothetical protein